MIKTDYKALNQRLFKEINNLKKNPYSFVKELEKMKNCFIGKEYRSRNLKFYFLMEEG